jgi:hypothetical protein
MMDEYRRGWAMRYLREARAELKAAQKMPCTASNLILEAVRKAQVAIYHSLGEPAFIETVVREAAEKKQATSDPILQCLLDIQKMVQQLAQLENVDGEKTMKQADNLIQLASDIVDLFTGETPEED